MYFFLLYYYYSKPVSYTHLDVYKRQAFIFEICYSCIYTSFDCIIPAVDVFVCAVDLIFVFLWLIVCIKAVSYTHLDVYKRQEWYLWKKWCRQPGIIILYTYNQNNPYHYTPVSYTHLDVYKRQIFRHWTLQHPAWPVSSLENIRNPAAVYRMSLIHI